MKKVFLISIAGIFVISIISLFSQEFTYVGAGRCKICHKTKKQGRQFPLWEKRKHSKSFAALTTEEVKVKVPDAPENPECLKCHVPLFEKNTEFKEEGVTCEVCHGPGSAYKKLSVMKSREESAKNGLILYGSAEAIKKQCLTCHDMAHEMPFDFEGAWEKVKHPIPEKQ
jgi:hypothetical protein